MAKSQVALPVADDEDEDNLNADAGVELDEAAFQAEQRRFAQGKSARTGGKSGKSGKVSPEDRKVDQDLAALKRDQEQDEADESDEGDEQDLADPSAQDEMEYADPEDAADGGDDEAAEGEDGDVDEEEDTHGPITTPKKGHAHGRYGFHTHADDADHSDAPLAADEAEAEAERGKQMSERPAARPATPAASGAVSVQLGELAALLAEDGDETSITLDDIRTLKRVARQLAEERVALQEQQFREEVTRLAEGFVRTLSLSETPDQTLPKPFSVAPSKVFRERFERFMLSEDGRSLSDEGRDAVCALIETAYLHGAVPQGQLAMRAPDATTPLPPAEVGSRTDRPAKSTDGPRGASQSRTVALAEGIAQREHGKKLGELGWELAQEIMLKAAKQANYKGAER